MNDELLTPDLIALARMLWSDEDQRALAEALEPGLFTSKASRGLFRVFAAHAEAGFTPATIFPVVKAEAPESAALCERLLGVTGTDGMFDGAPLDTLATAVEAHSKTVKFHRALTAAQKALGDEGGYDNARTSLERHLTSIDLSLLSARSYDDKADMAKRVTDFLRGDTGGGLKYGLAKLDERVVPIQLGHLIVFGGRPGTGKSTWFRNLTRTWVHQGERVAYFSLEMTGDEVLPLLACLDAGIDYRRFVRRVLTPAETSRFAAALSWWVECQDFRLNERGHVTPEWIFRQIRRYRGEGFTRIIVDHLHRVRYPKTEKGDIRLAIGDFARDLKSYAKDHGCSVVVGAQYTKGDKHEEPGDEMIKEAGEIIAEADAIFHTWLPLVAGLRTGDGSFLPTGEGTDRRIFASEAERGSDLDVDPTRAFLLIGKARVRDKDGIVAFPFNAATGLIADVDDSRYRVVA